MSKLLKRLSLENMGLDGARKLAKTTLPRVDFWITCIFLSFEVFEPAAHMVTQ